jgi:hypothetical protein
MATICLVKIDRSWRNTEMYKWKWMVLGALGCMNNADFGKKSGKWPYCATCVYYLSEITTRTSNLKNTVIVRTHIPSKPISQSVHSPLPTMWKASNTVSFTMYEFWHLMILVESHPFCKTFDLQLSFYIALCFITVEVTALYCSVY